MIGSQIETNRSDHVFVPLFPNETQFLPPNEPVNNKPVLLYFELFFQVTDYSVTISGMVYET